METLNINHSELRQSITYNGIEYKMHPTGGNLDKTAEKEESFGFKTLAVNTGHLTYLFVSMNRINSTKGV